jgi:Zn-finger nucleic acid-binding protein
MYSINCPRCQSSIRQEFYEGSLIETCPSCGGEWLDANEMTQINQERQKTFSSQEIASIEGAKQVVVTEVNKANPINCPHCKIPMKTINYAYSTGVMIDTCPRCHGMWLDQGELEAIQIITEEWDKKEPELRAKAAKLLKATNLPGQKHTSGGLKGFFVRMFASQNI